MRGTGVALLSQDPMSALTPHLRIETQLIEGLLDRGLATRVEARQRALEALREVEIPEPEARLRQYPHELSGGMRQRVALAMALMCTAAAAVRRRADHGARRERAGADPRVAAARARPRRRHPDHHARPRRRRRHRRSRGGDVRRPHRRVRPRPSACSRRRAHPYTAALLAAVPRLHGDAADAAREHRGSTAAARRNHGGLRVRAALPARLERCRHARPAALLEPRRASQRWRAIGRCTPKRRPA